MAAKNTSTNPLFQKFAEKFAFTDEQALIDTLKATAFKIKEGVVTDAQMNALLIVADQYGLNPFTKEIFAFPDKQNGIVPVVSVDGWSHLVNNHPQFDGVEFVYSNDVVTMPDGKPGFVWIECVMYRKDRSHPTRVREFLDEVYREPYRGNGKDGPYTINSPWQTHTKRMHRHKTMIQCARVAFGLVGIYDQDEAERIIEGQIVASDAVIEPSQMAIEQAAKLINRAAKQGAWQAALEYAGEKYSGIDLIYIVTELNNAKAQAEASLPKLPDTKQDSAAEAPLPEPEPETAKTKAQKAIDAAKAAVK